MDTVIINQIRNSRIANLIRSSYFNYLAIGFLVAYIGIFRHIDANKQHLIQQTLHNPLIGPTLGFITLLVSLVNLPVAFLMAVAIVITVYNENITKTILEKNYKAQEEGFANRQSNAKPQLTPEPR